MKHKSILFFAVSLIAGALFSTSCSQGLFSKVEIKASPTIYAPLGNKAFEIKKIFSISEVTKSLNTGETAGVYQWNDPASGQTDIMKLMIKYPIADVPVNFGEYLSNLDFAKSMNSDIAAIKFSIPEVDMTSTASTMTLDINAHVRTAASAGMATVSMPFLESGSPTSIGTNIPSVTLGFTSFDSLTFSAGSINFTVTAPSNPTPGLELMITTISLLDGNNTPITSNTVNLNILTGGTASLPLAGRKLPKDAKISFSGTTKGGSTGKSTPFNVTPSLSNDATISAATGINVTDPISIVDTTIPFSPDASFKSAVIGEGNIVLTFAGIPTDLASAIRTTINITQTDGLIASAPNAEIINEKVTIDLAGKNINRNTINVSSKFTIINGTISGINSSGYPITVTPAVTIKKLESVTVAPTNINLTQDFKEEIPADFKTWVTSIEFSEIGLRLTNYNNGTPADTSDDFVGLTNNLPKSSTANKNDIKITVTSTAFELTGDRTLSEDGGQASSNISRWLTFSPAGKTHFDFKVEIAPPGYNPTTKEFTLYNITPGQEIGFTGGVSLVSDWTEATINPSASAVSGKFPKDGQSPIDMTGLTEYLPAGVTFDNVPAYLYVSGIDNFSMNAEISASTVKDTVTSSRTILAKRKIDSVATPVFEVIENEFTGDLPSPQSAEFSLTDVFNARPDTMRIQYDLEPSEFKITKEDIDKSKSKAFKTEMVIILPLSISVAPNTKIETDLKPAETKTDLLGRKAGEVADKDDPLTIVMDSLISLNLDLSIVNTTGVAGTIYLTDWRSKVPNLATADPNDTIDNPITFELWSGFKEQLNISTGPNTSLLSLDKTKAQYIKNTIPFNPQMVITPDSKLAINKEGEISLSITVSAATSINHTFDLGGGN